MITGADKASLTLADGSTITLDNVQNGILSTQGNMMIVKQGGELHYQNQKGWSITQEEQFNTLSTPKGGQYQVKLTDGSKVWLNAASIIRYPVTFTSKERRVELIGEAYFEVTRNRNKPFKVNFISSHNSTNNQI